MAKEKNTKAAEKAAPAKSNEPEFKFGVADLAELMEIEPASVRVALRKSGIEKTGRSYGWNTQAELKAVAAELRTKDKAPVEKPKPKVKAAGMEQSKPKAKASVAEKANTAGAVAKAKVKKAA